MIPVMFRKKSRVFWGCALLLFLFVDFFLLWKVGIVSLGDLDAYRNMNFGQSKDEKLENLKEVEKEKKFGDQERAIPVSESKRKKVHSKKNETKRDHGLNCVCRDCRTRKNGRGSLFPIDN